MISLISVQGFYCSLLCYPPAAKNEVRLLLHVGGPRRFLNTMTCKNITLPFAILFWLSNHVCFFVCFALFCCLFIENEAPVQMAGLKTVFFPLQFLLFSCQQNPNIYLSSQTFMFFSFPGDDICQQYETSS